MTPAKVVIPGKLGSLIRLSIVAEFIRAMYNYRVNALIIVHSDADFGTITIARPLLKVAHASRDHRYFGDSSTNCVKFDV